MKEIPHTNGQSQIIIRGSSFLTPSIFGEEFLRRLARISYQPEKETDSIRAGDSKFNGAMPCRHDATQKCPPYFLSVVASMEPCLEGMVKPEFWQKIHFAHTLQWSHALRAW